MLRIVLGIIGGFFAWVIAWFGSEQVLSAMLPESFGAPQRTFQAAVENGGPFTADTTLLVSHIIVALVVSLMSGFLSALITRENKRAPLVLGILLPALGLMKAGMSWQYVPVWYHVSFTAPLLPMAIVGARLRTTKG